MATWLKVILTVLICCGASCLLIWIDSSPPRSTPKAETAKPQISAISETQIQKSDPTNLSPGEAAGIRLLALKQKGYIDTYIEEPGAFLLVEPKVWAAMLHKDKVILCNIAMDFFIGAIRQGGKKLMFFTVWDMTSRDTLAKGNLQDRSLRIYK